MGWNLYEKIIFEVCIPNFTRIQTDSRDSNLSLGLDDLIFFNRIFLSNDWMYVYIAIHLFVNFFNANDVLQIGGV